MVKAVRRFVWQSEFMTQSIQERREEIRQTMRRDYRVAVKHEAAVRARAWWPHELLLGSAVNHLTIASYLLMEDARNAFVCGGEPGAGDVAQVLWLLCWKRPLDAPLMAQPDTAWHELSGAVDFVVAVREIRDFFDRELYDLRSGAGPQSQPLAHWAAGHVRAMREHGMTSDQALNEPLPRVLQLERLEAVASGDKSALKQPSLDVMLRGAEAMNALAREAKEGKN